jgi:hypothetical protein
MRVSSHLIAPPPSLSSLTQVQLYCNGGAHLDLSGPVMDRALLHVDGCYKWPSFYARGVVCRTHTPPNTAFRGFGGPQVKSSYTRRQFGFVPRWAARGCEGPCCCGPAAAFKPRKSAHMNPLPSHPHFLFQGQQVVRAATPYSSCSFQVSRAGGST